MLHINDPILIHKLTQLLIAPFSYKDEDLLTLSWYVYSEGDT